MTGLSFQPLPKDKIVQAFPLVRELHPRLSLDDWTHTAAALVADGAGKGVITALRNGYMRGLFTYRLAAAPDGGNILVIEDLVVMDMLPADNITTRVAEEIGTLAGTLSADHVQVNTAIGESLAEALEDAGFEVRSRTAP